jgi:hypothetical protein
MFVSGRVACGDQARIFWPSAPPRWGSRGNGQKTASDAAPSGVSILRASGPGQVHGDCLIHDMAGDLPTGQATVTRRAEPRASRGLDHLRAPTASQPRRARGLSRPAGKLDDRARSRPSRSAAAAGRDAPNSGHGPGQVHGDCLIHDIAVDSVMGAERTSAFTRRHCAPSRAA